MLTSLDNTSLKWIFLSDIFLFDFQNTVMILMKRNFFEIEIEILKAIFLTV